MPIFLSHSVYVDCTSGDDVGSGRASVNMNSSVMVDVRCRYKLTMRLTASDAAGGENASSSVLIDSAVFVPDYKRSRAYTNAGRPSD